MVRDSSVSAAGALSFYASENAAGLFDSVTSSDVKTGWNRNDGSLCVLWMATGKLSRNFAPKVWMERHASVWGNTVPWWIRICGVVVLSIFLVQRETKKL